MFIYTNRIVIEEIKLDASNFILKFYTQYENFLNDLKFLFRIITFIMIIIMSFLSITEKIEDSNFIIILIIFLLIDLLITLFIKLFSSKTKLVLKNYDYRKVNRIELSTNDEYSLKLGIGSELYIKYLDQDQLRKIKTDLQNLVSTDYLYNSFIGKDIILYWKN